MGKHSMRQSVRLRIPPPGYVHPPASTSTASDAAYTVAAQDTTVSDDGTMAAAATDSIENPLTTLMGSLGTSGRSVNGGKQPARRTPNRRGKPLPTISFIDRNMVIAPSRLLKQLNTSNPTSNYQPNHLLSYTVGTAHAVARCWVERGRLRRARCGVALHLALEPPPPRVGRAQRALSLTA